MRGIEGFDVVSSSSSSSADRLRLSGLRKFVISFKGCFEADLAEPLGGIAGCLRLSQAYKLCQLKPTKAWFKDLKVHSQLVVVVVVR